MSKEIKMSLADAFEKADRRESGEYQDRYGDARKIFKSLMGTCGFSQYDEAIRQFGGEAPPFEWEGTDAQQEFHDIASEKWDETKQGKRDAILTPLLEDNFQFARLADYLEKMVNGQELSEDIEDAFYRIVRETQLCLSQDLFRVMYKRAELEHHEKAKNICRWALG